MAKSLKTFQWSLPCVQIFWELPEDRQAEGLLGMQDLIQRVHGSCLKDEMPLQTVLYFDLTREQTEGEKLYDEATIANFVETRILHEGHLEPIMQDFKTKGILGAHRYLLFVGREP